jgi:NAD-dependent SIR2 family protein deacetylase
MPPNAPDQISADIPHWAHGVRSLVVLSGAGISTDSGIGDFRGAAGAWTLNPGAQHTHTHQAFMADGELRGRYWKSRAEHPAWNAVPNAGHLAVASLADSDIATTVVTQNTDGLHQRAGTPADRVIELHGTMHESVCVACGHRSATTDVLARIAAGEATPPCLRCGGIMKTASTMFGQTMAPDVFARARLAVTTCDLVLAVGTTLSVEPAGSLCASAVRAGANLVIVNWDPTPYDGIASAIIRDPLSEALPRIGGQLQAAGTRFDGMPEHAQTGPNAPLAGAELASLRLAADRHGLRLPADAAASAAATAILCGAADEAAAVAALGHVPGLADVTVRTRVARWLRELYPPAPGESAYLDAALPGPQAEELIAAVVTPRFLLRMLTETTPEQDRRALTVLARAAETRPVLRSCLTDLLSLLPGLSPTAVQVALGGGYSGPLAEALTALARNVALPAHLLDAVPAGTTALGEFPVLLAEGLVEAYEHRAKTENGLRGLAGTLVELSGRLADLGLAERALAAARRSVEAAGRLADPLDYPARAAQALQRATDLARLAPGGADAR